MLIYFDESYDLDRTYLLLGALFNPHPRFLHNEFVRSKQSLNYKTKTGSLKELKYAEITSRKDLIMAKEAIDIFMKSTSWFRCIVIEESLVDLDWFGDSEEEEKIKRARMYKKFAERLIGQNCEDIYNGTMLTDHLTRCRGDLFLEKMREEFCQPYKRHSDGKAVPTLKYIDEVHSHMYQYQVLQICDVMLGCVLNNLLPTRQLNKNEARLHLVGALGVPDLLPTFWKQIRKTEIETRSPKFNIWYWRPLPKKKTQAPRP